MSPSPLSPNVLHILLQYISPPSQLTHPIPPHLLSKPLLQRHHFLHLTPEHPDEYLCWPSTPERIERVLDLLESRARPLDDDQPTVYPVQYSFDGEDFYSHVDLGSGTENALRVVLQWDDSGEWKYHNTELMPFPPGSRPALVDVLVPPSPPHQDHVSFLSAPRTRVFDVDDLQDDSDDGDYWNAYGATDIGDGLYHQDAHVSAKDASSAEDAYWAQYASVQGTADSTIPSPIPQRRKPLPAPHPDIERATDSPVPLPVPVRVPSEDTYAEPLPIPSSILPRPMEHSKWDPASPTALARLLSTISPRPGPALYGSFDVEEELSSPTVGGSNASKSDVSCSPGVGLQEPEVITSAPIDVGEVQLPTPAPVSHTLEMSRPSAEAEGNALNGEGESDLCAALEGVWRLWKKTRSAIGPSATSDSEDREVFLRAAQLVAYA